MKLLEEYNKVSWYFHCLAKDIVITNFNFTLLCAVILQCTDRITLFIIQYPLCETETPNCYVSRSILPLSLPFNLLSKIQVWFCRFIAICYLPTGPMTKPYARLFKSMRYLYDYLPKVFWSSLMYETLHDFVGEYRGMDTMLSGYSLQSWHRK